MSKIQGTLAQWRDRLRRKELSPAELVNLTADAIEADRTTNAYISFDREAALHAAAGADISSPLAGIPIAVKDNINVLGQPTRCASRLLSPYVAPYDATSIRLLKEAGGIPLGRTNMDEFAMGASGENSAYGITRNPEAPDRIPGGSSSGSAAAVASATAVAALGSDTGGSIRQPGSFCGAVAVKPTYGVVSRYGVVAFGSSLDQVGPFTRSVEDAAFALNAIAGRDVLDCTSQDLDVDFTANLAEGVKGMRIGVVPAFMEAQGLTDEVKAKVEEAVEHLRALGADIVEVELPNAQAAMSAYYVLGPCEAFSNLARFDSVRYGYCDLGHKDLGGQYEASRAKGFGPEARRRIMLGSYLLSAGVYDTYYYPAQQVRTLITQDYARAYEQVDCIVAPVSPRTAFTFGEVSDPTDMYLSDMFTISINIAGNGGMSLPVGLGAQTQLPVGVQLISPQFKDQNMLRVAAALETVYGPAPVAPAFAPGQPYPEGSMADIPDAADATPGVDLPGLLTEEGGFGVAHQASSAAQRGLSERLGNAEAAPFQVEKAGE